MRISVKNSDPGYEQWVHLGGHDSRLEVWFDGQKLDNCITADTEAGLVICYDVSDEGRQWARMAGEMRKVEQRGHVKIMLNGAVLASSPIPQTEEKASVYVTANGDIHELLREIDKAVEGYLDMGAKIGELALKLPRAAKPALNALCEIRIGTTVPTHYSGIPITEWTDGPFMSFGIDWKPFANIEREWKPGDSPVLPSIAIPNAADQPNDLTGADFAKGGPVPAGMFGLVGERGPEPIMPIKRTLTEEEGAGKTVSIDIAFDQPLTWPHGGLKGYDPLTIIADDPFADSFISADDLRAAMRQWFNPKPRRSKVAAMMAARRAWAKKHRKPKPFTSQHDEGVHRAISAMQKPGRANEL